MSFNLEVNCTQVTSCISCHRSPTRASGMEEKAHVEMLSFPPLSGHFAASGLQVRYHSVWVCLLLVRIASGGQEVGAHVSCITQDIMWSIINADQMWFEWDGKKHSTLFLWKTDACWDMVFGDLTTQSFQACHESEGPKAMAWQDLGVPCLCSSHGPFIASCSWHCLPPLLAHPGDAGAGKWCAGPSL